MVERGAPTAAPASPRAARLADGKNGKRLGPASRGISSPSESSRLESIERIDTPGGSLGIKLQNGSVETRIAGRRAGPGRASPNVFANIQNGATLFLHAIYHKAKTPLPTRTHTPP